MQNYDKNDRYNKNNTMYSSINGERNNITKKKKRISKVERMRRKLLVCAACLVIGGVAVDKIDDVISKMEQNAIVNDQKGDFAMDVINEHTHRTSDNSGYYRNYDKIANDITNSNGDFSRNLYFTYSIIGEEETNSVLAYTQYNDIETFLNKNNYSSTDEWVKDEKKEIILEHNMNIKQNELSKMQGEYNELISGGNGNSLDQRGGVK